MKMRRYPVSVMKRYPVSVMKRYPVFVMKRYPVPVIILNESNILIQFLKWLG